MLTAVVPALALPRQRPVGPDRPAARPIPVLTLPARRTADTVFGLTVLDRYGRVADQTVLRALDWTPGQAVGLAVVAGSVLAAPDQNAPTRVGADGQLRLPIGVRRACALTAGDRVLLAADPATSRLLLHPPAALDALHAHHTTLLSEVASR